jgi:hypothetical protein
MFVIHKERKFFETEQSVWYCLSYISSLKCRFHYKYKFGDKRVGYHMILRLFNNDISTA